MQQCIKICIIPYLYEAQHVSGYTLPIIWSLCMTTSTNYTSNNRPRMKNRGLPVQFRLLMMGGVT